MKLSCSTFLSSDRLVRRCQKWAWLGEGGALPHGWLRLSSEVHSYVLVTFGQVERSVVFRALSAAQVFGCFSVPVGR